LSLAVHYNDLVVGKRAECFGVNGTNPFAGIDVDAGDAIAPISPPYGKAQELHFVHRSILCLKMDNPNAAPFLL
jgi:hypothetical protein